MAKSVKHQLPQLLLGIDFVTLDVFQGLLQQTNASPGYLKKLLREQAVPLHPIIEGVRQDDLPNLTRTLNQLAELYASQPHSARAVVLESKRHTQLNLAKSPTNSWRNQVLLHLNTWLENPAIYSLWARIQTQNAASP